MCKSYGHNSVEAQEMPANNTDVQEQTVAEEGTLPVKAKPRNRATTAAARTKKRKPWRKRVSKTIKTWF